METAPIDGTMVRLLVEFESGALEDTDQPVWTVGACHAADSTGYVWQFAGWNWTHDCFTEGSGTPIGWLPMIEAALTAAKEALEQPVPSTAGEREESLVDAFDNAQKLVTPEMLESFDAALLQSTAMPAQKECKPVFYWRPLKDGMYEGPVHANSVGGKMMRDEKPDEWKPLYAESTPAALPVGELMDTEKKHAFVLWSEYESKIESLTNEAAFHKSLSAKALMTPPVTQEITRLKSIIEDMELAAASSQPVREPLTEDQVSRLYRQTALQDRIFVRSDWEQGLRDGEAAHGITKKGEQ